MAKRILLAGGGTGGHVYPLSAIAQAVRQQSPETELQFIGDGALLASEAAQLGLVCHRLLAPKWRRYFSWRNWLDLLKLPVGLLQALCWVWRLMPEVIFIKGGYSAALPALVGKLFFIPLVVHESDAAPGRVNRWFGRGARQVFLALEAAKPYFPAARSQIVGNPIRPAVLAVTDPATARLALGLTPDRPTVLIIGASQGAQALNAVLLLALAELVKHFQIIHQTGPAHFAGVQAAIQQLIAEGKDSYGPALAAGYKVFAGFDAAGLAQAYSAADVVLSRAGSVIFELAARGLPMLLVPLPQAAGDHQLANARAAQAFGAIVIEQTNLTPHILLTELAKAYQNRQALGQQIRALAKLDAAAVIAQYLVNV